MSSTTRRPPYRRRILGLGAVAAVAVLAVGGPRFVEGIETDLEDRVPAALEAAGFSGVTATFSGQDGVVSCAAPLADPVAAEGTAYEVWGVRAIELDRSCRVRSATVETTVPSVRIAASTTVSDAPSTALSSAMTADSFESVHDAILANPQFEVFSRLADSVGLADLIGPGAAGPVTLFAPTDVAFDGLPAGALAKLDADPELARRVLEHHLVAGRLTAADLKTGSLTALDGTTLDVDGGPPVKVGAGTVTESDLTTRNGVVHAVDRVLLPPGVELSTPAQATIAVVTWDGESIRLSGVVANRNVREVLVDAATGGVGADHVVDETNVDDTAGVKRSVAERLALVVAAMPEHLATGEARFEDGELTIVGVANGPEAGAAMSEVAATASAARVDVSVGLDPEVERAAELERQLNRYVGEHPILFETGSARLGDTAEVVLDEIALRILAVDGVVVAVEGHTDSDGDADANLRLSQERADAVRDALVDRGLDPASITASGRGESELVLVDGEEDPAASRRVVFEVSGR